MKAISGFNRLVLALAFLWALFWVVVYPLKVQWDRHEEAFASHDEDYKNCGSLTLDHPDYDTVKNCFKLSDETLQNKLRLYSFRDFWVLPVALWRLFLPLIVVPPLALYGLASLAVWVRKGFVRRTA
jgi:hypothetical protein